MRETAIRIVHRLAIAVGLVGIYLIVADSFDVVLYGFILFATALATEIAIATRCHEENGSHYESISCPFTDTRPLNHRH